MSKKKLIHQLAEYALSKKAAQQAYSSDLDDELVRLDVKLPTVTWGSFFEIEQDADDKNVAAIPVVKSQLSKHRKKYPALRETEWAERDGHIQMHVPLDSTVPLEFIKTLIDEAHSIVWNKLNDNGRLRIELATGPYDELKIMDRLIDSYQLQKRRSAIHDLARPAVLLVTKRSSDDDIPIGSTKIGGMPDLPKQVEWPAYHTGRPLAFLAQIDLAEIAQIGTPIKGLPAAGLISVFSVWGWVSEDSLDPETPQDNFKDQKGWTAVVHTPPKQSLERREPPDNVNSFQAAAVDPVAISSLPNHRIEPPLAALKWTKKDYERFDEMQSDYRSVQLAHWLKSMNSMASHHLLGGYALFQQQFPEELLKMKHSMLLQIGSDSNTGMCWGDGGELTFYADTAALAKGKIERVWCEHQCG